MIGGYSPTPASFDTILVGYREKGALLYAGSVRAGFERGARQALLAAFDGMSASRCPFRNLPDRTRGRWGEGMTAEKMAACRWLKPRLVASVEFLEWTPEMRLRHPRFVGLR